MQQLKRISLTMIFMLSIPMGALRAEEVSIYVSPSGNDSWTGKTPDKPFATLEKARDEVRKLRSGGTSPDGFKIILRGGIYELDETFVLEPRDSGARNAPVSYVAFENEIPVISGGKKISGVWSKHDGRVWVLDIPDVKNRNWYFRQLFSDGKRLTRSRTPNEGYFTIAEPKGEIKNNEMPFEGSDIRPWNNLESAEIVLFHSWNESRLLISAIDAERNIVAFTGPIGRNLEKGRRKNRYYVENTLEGVDSIGEWYLDRTSGKLYLFHEGDPASLNLRAPRLPQIMMLRGNGKNGGFVEYVNFEGLTFAESDWLLPEEGFPSCGDVGDIIEPSAVAFSGARYCTFGKNTIRNTGTYAIEITGYGNRITGNELSDCGSGGIISRCHNPELNIISNNHIHDCGKVYHSAVGVNIDDGGGEISHNHIHDISHSGIYARHWATESQEIERRNQEQGLVIAFNEIHDVMKDMNDGGAIFVRDSNIVIQNNLIYDVKSFGRGTPGWGIYLGCETRNARVFDNIVYRTTEGLHIWHGNRDNIIENNIFVDGDLALVKSNNPKDRKHDSVIIRHNIFSYYRRDIDLFKVDGENSLPLVSDYNLYWNPFGCIWMSPVIWGLEGTAYFEEWQNRGFDSHSKVVDPKFRDYRKNDYELLPDSPAFSLGFKPIDMTGVGLRGEGARR